MAKYKPHQRQRKPVSAEHLEIDPLWVRSLIRELDVQIESLESQTEVSVCECCGREHYSDLAAHRTRESLGAARSRLRKVLETL